MLVRFGPFCLDAAPVARDEARARNVKTGDKAVMFQQDADTAQWTRLMKYLNASLARSISLEAPSQPSCFWPVRAAT